MTRHMRLPDVLVRHLFEPLWDRYEHSSRLTELRALRRSQWNSVAEIRALQDRRLSALVRHAAATSPFYAERFRSRGIDPSTFGGLDDLQRIPTRT